MTTVMSHLSSNTHRDCIRHVIVQDPLAARFNMFALCNISLLTFKDTCGWDTAPLSVCVPQCTVVCRERQRWCEVD